MGSSNWWVFIFDFFWGAKFTIRRHEKIMLVQCTYGVRFFVGDDLDMRRFYLEVGYKALNQRTFSKGYYENFDF
jgi:hypothetical protein